MQVTNQFALLPAVSPDGKLIACQLRDQQTRTWKLALLPFEGGDPVKLLDAPQAALQAQYVGQSPRWTPDGRSVIYIATHGLVSNVWAQPLDGGQPRQLTDFKSGNIFSFDFSRDGKQIALSRGTVDSDVVLISNFK